MNYIYLILVLVIAGLIWVVWKCYQKNEADRKEILALEKEKNEYAELGKGLAEYNQKLQEKKNQVKEKILALVKAKPKTSNHNVAEKLGISRSSVKRYLDELEAENKITQVGKSGRSVFYTAK